MVSTKPSSNGDGPGPEIDPALIEFLSDFHLGDISGISLEEFGSDRRSAERQLREAADALGMRVEFREVVGFEVTAGPPDLPVPRGAWLLVGDAAVYPTRKDLAGASLEPDPDDPSIWSAPPLVSTGDLLFFYFAEPYGAVHFIARASDRPYWSDLGPSPDRSASAGQWWVPYCAMVKIEPVPADLLREIVGDDSLLRREVPTYIAPSAANRLLERVRIVDAPAEWCADLALESVAEDDLPAGGADAGAEDAMRIPSWALDSRQKVGALVVEPLLRELGFEPPTFEVRRDVDLGPGVADYAILVGEEVVCIIATTPRIRLDDVWDWQTCHDVDKVAAMADARNVPYMIVDCDQFFCFQVGEREPFFSADRFELSEDDLDSIYAHIAGEAE
jgi:hypothetical protein